MKKKRKKASPLTSSKKVEDSKGIRSEQKETAEDESGEKNPWMNLTGGTKMKRKAKKLEDAQVSSNDPDVVVTEIDVDAVIEIQESKLEANSLLSKQKDIVEEAFAGLDVYKEFEEEKLAIINEGDDAELTAQELPGWGSWAGEGVKMTKRQKWRLNKKKLEKEKELKERAAKRKDAKLKHVIINENVNEKFEKYQLQQLPFEYGNARHYERSIAQPLGPEWNTLTIHSTLTKPAVVTKPGLIINPLEEPQKQQKKQSPANTRRQTRRQRKF